MEEPPRALNKLPFDIIGEIGQLLLDDELPDATTLVPLSNLSPNNETGWRRAHPTSVCRRHEPLASAIGGTLLYRLPKHTGNRLSILRLSQVSHGVRKNMLDNRGIWSRGALAQVSLLQELVRRAQPNSVNLTTRLPQCGCDTPALLRCVPHAHCICLTLPAYTIAGNDSSHAFAAEIRANGVLLKDIELRFATLVERSADWEIRYPSPSPDLSTVRLLNAHFTFVGVGLRKLHLGQESAQLRWGAHAVCQAIAACPKLEDLALYTVMKPHIEGIDAELLPANFDGTIDSEIVDLPRLNLEFLRFLYLSDEAYNCVRLLDQFSVIRGDLHVDAIVELGTDDVDDSLFLLTVIDRLQPLLGACRRHFEGGERGRTAIAAFLPDRALVGGVMQDLWDNWPERVVVGLAANEEDAMLMTGDSPDFTPLPNRRRCSFAIRSASTSVRPVSQVVRDNLIIGAPKPSLLIGSLLEVTREMFQLPAVTKLLLPPQSFVPEVMADWRHVLESFEKLEVIDSASRSNRSPKSLGHYLRTRNLLSGEPQQPPYPLLALREVNLRAYMATPLSSWTTQGAFNAGMRNLMARSPRRGGAEINWVAPRLPV